MVEQSMAFLTDYILILLIFQESAYLT